MDGSRILVCGGRNFNNYEFLRDTLYKICDDRKWNSKPDELGNCLPNVTIIHGGASGADLLADQWAVVNWCHILEFKADWNKYGKAAGPIRNQKMLFEGHPDLVVAFPTRDSIGTWHMVKIARQENVETIVYESE